MKHEDAPDSCIWLHGNVGYGDYYLSIKDPINGADIIAGKSVLASLVVNELQAKDTTLPLPNGTKTCYFYCQEDYNEHRTYLDILKGILLQMVESDDYILPLCHQEKMTSGGANLLDAGVAQKLIKTFIEYSPRQYIIIDGLEECEGTEIKQTALFFKELVSLYDTQLRQGHLRVMFVGRETTDTRSFIPGVGCLSVELKSEDNHDDIRSFVQKRLPEFSSAENRQGFGLSNADRDDIQRIVCHKSQGMYPTTDI